MTEKFPFDFWKNPALVEPNNFKFKSLSCWSFNIAVGCGHGCRYCYVPDSSTKHLARKLKAYGVSDPDAEWGDYALLRPLDEKKLLASIKSAENTPLEKLNPDGNRAVMMCSTTDPYQVFRAQDSAKTKELNEAARKLVRRCLELILNESTLNVRILTRSPLAKEDFDLFKLFGHRLTFGMSIPTLDDKLARIYEPNAPAPSQRLKAMKAAKTEGLNVFVALAPTYPECDEADLRKTIKAVAALDPITIYHEPINIRADNVQRIAEHAKSLGRELNTQVFDDGHRWRAYAIDQLMTVQRLAQELGVHDHLHLWPDKSLKSKSTFLEIRKQAFDAANPHATTHEQNLAKEADLHAYEQFEQWINAWHSRISEWPVAPTKELDATAAADSLTPASV